MADKRTESSATRKELNRQVRMAVKRFDLSVSEGETWAFLCECGDPGCDLSVDARVGVAAAAPVLADQHACENRAR